jgi:hypothetical protein
MILKLNLDRAFDTACYKLTAHGCDFKRFDSENEIQLFGREALDIMSSDMDYREWDFVSMGEEG